MRKDIDVSGWPRRYSARGQPVQDDHETSDEFPPVHRDVARQMQDELPQLVLGCDEGRKLGTTKVSRRMLVDHL
jgi:hypothetical protein